MEFNGNFKTISIKKLVVTFIDVGNRGTRRRQPACRKDRWNCGAVPTMWYFLFFHLIVELYRQCSTFCFSIWLWSCTDNVVLFVFLFDCGAVPTMWYFLFFHLIVELYRQCSTSCFSIWLWSCTDSVVLFVFLFYYGAVPTMWYFLLSFYYQKMPYMF